MACGAAGHDGMRLHELAMPSSIERMTAALTDSHPEVIGVYDEHSGIWGEPQQFIGPHRYHIRYCVGLASATEAKPTQ
jgi:hypothetical protein